MQQLQNYISLTTSKVAAFRNFMEHSCNDTDAPYSSNYKPPMEGKVRKITNGDFYAGKI